MLIQEALILLAQLAKVTIKGRFFVSGWDRRFWRSTVSESACGNDKLGVVDLRCRLGLLRSVRHRDDRVLPVLLERKNKNDAPIVASSRGLKENNLGEQILPMSSSTETTGQVPAKRIAGALSERRNTHASKSVSYRGSCQFMRCVN